jgi:hypothetical protein
MKTNSLHVALIVMLFAPATIFGNTVTLQPTPDIGQDTFVDKRSPDSNFSDAQIMCVYPTYARSFLQFTQLNEYIGYQVTSATMVLALEGTEWGTRWFCRVLEPWDERMVTWNNQPAYSYTDYLEFTEEQQYKGDHHYDVTGVVNKWLSGEWQNYGWAIATGDPDMIIYTSNNTDPDNRPELILEGPNLPPLSVQPTSLGKIKSLYSPQQISAVEDGRGQFAKHSKREAWATIICSGD